MYIIYNNNSQTQFFFGNCSTVRSFALTPILSAKMSLLSVFTEQTGEQRTVEWFRYGIFNRCISFQILVDSFPENVDFV